MYGTSSPVSTFTLQVHIGTKLATTMVDSGSDVSIINAKFVVKANYKISPALKAQIVVADGKIMLSESACVACPYEIQKHHFSSDFRLLDVQGYDLILGADWIYQNSPARLNLKTRELSVTKNGNQVVTFTDNVGPTSNQLIGTKKLCKMLKRKSIAEVIMLRTKQTYSTMEAHPPHEDIHQLLDQYSDIFQEQHDLPPVRNVDHTIPLIDEQRTVTQRTHRLPHHQKKCNGIISETALAVQDDTTQHEPLLFTGHFGEKEGWHLEALC